MYIPGLSLRHEGSGAEGVTPPLEYWVILELIDEQLETLHVLLLCTRI